jgi:hypothetical protein
MFKRQRGARQDCLLITGNGDVVGCTFEAGPDYIIDYNSARAWELDYSQQVQDKKTGKLIQYISELDRRPIKVYKNRTAASSDTALNIFHRKVKEALSQLEVKKKNNGMLLWLGIIAGLFCLTISIVVLTNI